MLRTAVVTLLLVACGPAPTPQAPASNHEELDDIELRLERISRRLKRVEDSNQRLYERMEEILKALGAQLTRVRTETPD